MHHTSQINLSKSALQKNYNFLRNTIQPEVKISSVVKGNAYGHGIEEFIPLAESCGFNHFSVFSADEANRVKMASTKNSPVMIMGDINPGDLEWVIDNDVDFFVFEIERVEQAAEISKRIKKKARIHIEFETGFNRTGFNSKELVPLVKLLQDNRDHISVEGVCTHFAGAESVANHVRVQKQMKTFNKLYKWLLGQGIEPKMRHTACSAAAMVYPKARMDMVRVGILQFGFWPSKEVFIDYLSKVKNHKDKVDPLKRVVSWSSRVMSVKNVKTGEFIGYGTSFLAQQNMKVAAVPVGYAHGYSRVLSNQGRALVGGRRVGVVGTVNMNMLMLDITDVPDVSVGDDVVLIGGEDGLEISVASFGELSNQLNYELLTRLPMNIPRYLVD
ncbi:alanine racemase [Fulvivirga sp. RKSG066]|uniref:alanine racemase n=1 Tax=Fulvivirga aurantia TaxID=2529383 RepID=UPI0012BBB8BD|nr:alanine racemase [Fulvivirga aurantia]MTI20441.1 alanine racemase [Fulvivirga aurantia]